MRNLSGMVVVITGASTGIGAALARQLDAAGAFLALGARRMELLDKLPISADHLRLNVDVSDPEACAGFIRAASERWGRIDTLVANAGYGFFAEVENTSMEQWQQIIATNLLGTAACINAAMPGLRANPLRDDWRGQVMVVSSGLARRAMPDMAAYSATKAAQLSLCEALRVESREARIAVTSVHPVSTKSEFFATADRITGVTWARSKGLSEPTQTVDQVAEAMVRAIRKPRPECWPYPLARWMLGVGSLWPSLADRIMFKHRRRPTQVTAPME